MHCIASPWHAQRCHPCSHPVLDILCRDPSKTQLDMEDIKGIYRFCLSAKSQDAHFIPVCMFLSLLTEPAFAQSCRHLADHSLNPRPEPEALKAQHGTDVRRACLNHAKHLWNRYYVSICHPTPANLTKEEEPRQGNSASVLGCSGCLGFWVLESCGF